ncbi:unnamed protein product [Vitrella brassicaformis CCMP3155]|uniref:endo-1,4-beta-xylanase n=2 Tax=Vitrella brassicaformis TaxID=1169539 RepID=A0A0G4F302_VITBC|nr:unnamed protein product [Vitrella brassicaformis CCMP3155]|eukprot:CEM06601.1 unnamed protein product [Vitrella brassicaformis CCMP3155]
MDACYHPGWDYWGHDLLSAKEIGSAEECQTRCQAHRGSPPCAVFTYRTQERQCWLKSEMALAEPPREDTNAISGPRFCVTGCLSEGSKLTSSPVGSTDTSTVEECRSLCARYPRCRAYTFIPSSQRCELHASLLCVGGIGGRSPPSGSSEDEKPRPHPESTPKPADRPRFGGEFSNFHRTNRKSFQDSHTGRSQQGTLRALADRHNLYIGAAMNIAQMNDARYLRTVRDQYSMVVAEWECKMAAIAPSPNNRNWSLCDRIADFARQQGLHFRFHTFAWHNSLPGWYKNQSPQAKRSMLDRYIGQVVDRYGDRSFWWDVVNEALSDNQVGQGHNVRWRDSPLYPAMRDWVSYSFKMAQKHMKQKKPGTPYKFYYNDYGVASLDGWSRPKSNAMYTMVRQLVDDRNVHIDGVGFQLHVNTKFSMFEGVRKNVRRYAKLGLEVQFTEVDVGCGEWRGANWHNCNNWGPDQARKQADIYSGLLRICLEEPNCTGYVMWGVSDRATWLRGAYPLIYDGNFQPKPAYWAMRDTLQKFGN